MPVIQATQEAEDHGLKPAGANSSRDPISKRAGGVTQGVDPEFKPF
jgi:hypothetical protein